MRGKIVKIQCTKCGEKNVYLPGNKERQCSYCHYGFTSKSLPLCLTKVQWKKIINWFLLDQSSPNTALGTSHKRKRFMRALTIESRVLTKEVPEIFSGTVKVDDTCLGRSMEKQKKSNPGPRQNTGEIRCNRRIYRIIRGLFPPTSF